MIQLLRRRLFTLLGILLCIGLTACGGSNSDLAQGKLTIGIWRGIDTLDPFLAEDSINTQIVGALYKGLVAFDASGQIVPAIAESWNVSADGTTYTFRLKDSVWSNGEPIIADNFVQSLRRWFEDNRTPSPALTSLRNGEDILAGRAPRSSLGVRALADNVLEIQLVRPEPALLATLAGPGGVPLPKAALHRPEDWWQKPKNIITNGSYRLVKWDPGKGLTLVADQRGPHSPPLSTISYTLVGPPQAALQAFAEGKIQLLDVSDIDIRTQEDMSSRVRNALRWAPLWTVTGLAVNVTAAGLNDLHVRRALTLAIDRQALVDTAFPGQHFRPATALVPPALPSYGQPAQPDWATLSQDERQAEAQRLLAAVGYTADHPLSLTLTIADHDEDGRLAQALSDQLANLNVKLAAIVLKGDEWHRRMVAGRFVLARSSRHGDSDNAEQFMLPYRCNQSVGRSGYCSPAVDAALETGRGMSDTQGRAANLRLAESQLLTDVPFIPLYLPTTRVLIAKDLEGWIDNPGNHHPLESLKPKGH